MTAPLGIGRYEVKNRIGHGGMGTLYLGHDPKIDRLVVIKVLKADFEEDEFRTRFDREARAIGALNHPNIVVIHDYGEFEGSPFIVMEYIRGVTLREVIGRQTPMLLTEKLRLFEQLCAGLSYAHQVGILHRDIKPANLMVDQHGSLKILDFGIARLAESGQTRATSGPVGTPGYMSPEQIRAQPLDGRSDVFAVGAVAYEVVCGREAFPGANYHTILHRVLNEPPPSPSSVAPGVDLELEAVILQALEKDLTRRFQDASALMRAFERIRLRMERPGPSAALDYDPLAPTLANPPPPAPRPTPAAPVKKATTSAAEDRAVWVQRLLDEAQRALDEGDYLAADAALHKVEEFNISDERLQVLRDELEDDSARSLQRLLESALAHVNRKEYTEAEGILEEACKLDPQSEETRRLQAEVKAARSQWDRDADAMTVRSQLPPAAAPAKGAVKKGAVKKEAVKQATWTSGLRVPAKYRTAGAVLAAAVVIGALWLFLWTPGPPDLRLTMFGATGGTVLVNGKPCGRADAPCIFPPGKEVQLKAQPDPGYTFGSFTGVCAGVANNSTLRMAAPPPNCSVSFTNLADAAVSQVNGFLEASDYSGAIGAIDGGARSFPSDARFPDLLEKLYSKLRNDLTSAKDAVKVRAEPKYSLAAEKAKQGEQLAGLHQDGEAVKALAEATSLYRELADTASAPVPTGPKPSTLSFTVSPGGVVLVGTDEKPCLPGTQACIVKARVGDNVVLRAKPESGYQFAGFSGPCEKIADGGSLAVSSTALTCAASFTALPSFKLTMTVSGPGTVSLGSLGACDATTAPCQVTVRSGDTVTLEPKEVAGSRFQAFSDACQSRSFVMPARDVSCSASFSAIAAPPPPPKPTGTSRSFAHPGGGVTLALWVQAPPEAGPNGKGFYFDQSFVTKERFQQFLKTKPEFQKSAMSATQADRGYLRDISSGTPNDPVTWVSYEAARGYCAFAGGRLPTDSEWDRAIDVKGVTETKELLEWVAEKAANQKKAGTHFQLNATRDKLVPQKTQKDLGFRCARDESAVK